MGMENENFDMAGAVDSIGSELGFGGGSADDDLDDPGELGGGSNSITDPAPAPSPAPAPTDPAPAPTDPAAPAPTPDPTAVAPRTWRPEAAAEWANLPPGVKAEIHKREEDIFRGLETYKADANFGKTVQSVLAPYDNVMKQYNIDPMQQISGLMNAHYTLALGTPEAKVNLLRSLINDYQIDTGALLPQQDGQQPYVDPEVAALREHVRMLENQTNAITSERRAQQQKEVEGEVAKFVADPANIYVKDLVPDMVKLLHSGNMSVKEAYEQAIWLNPAVRQREIDRQQTERATKAAREAEEKAAAARKATAAKVRSSAKSGSAAAPAGSMDDTLAETLAAIQSRG